MKHALRVSVPDEINHSWMSAFYKRNRDTRVGFASAFHVLPYIGEFIAEAIQVNADFDVCKKGILLRDTWALPIAIYKDKMEDVTINHEFVGAITASSKTPNCTIFVYDNFEYTAGHAAPKLKDNYTQHHKYDAAFRYVGMLPSIPQILPEKILSYSRGIKCDFVVLVPNGLDIEGYGTIFNSRVIPFYDIYADRDGNHACCSKDFRIYRGLSGAPVYQISTGRLFSIFSVGIAVLGGHIQVFSNMFENNSIHDVVELPIVATIPKIEKLGLHLIVAPTATGKSTSILEKMASENPSMKYIVYEPRIAIVHGVAKYMRDKYPSLSIGERTSEKKVDISSCQILYSTTAYLKEDITTFGKDVVYVLDEAHDDNDQTLYALEILEKNSKDIKAVMLTATPSKTCKRIATTTIFVPSPHDYKVIKYSLNEYVTVFGSLPAGASDIDVWVKKHFSDYKCVLLKVDNLKVCDALFQLGWGEFSSVRREYEGKQFIAATSSIQMGVTPVGCDLTISDGLCMRPFYTQDYSQLEVVVAPESDADRQQYAGRTRRTCDGDSIIVPTLLRAKKEPSKGFKRRNVFKALAEKDPKIQWLLDDEVLRYLAEKLYVDPSILHRVFSKEVVPIPPVEYDSLRGNVPPVMIDRVHSMFKPQGGTRFITGTFQSYSKDSVPLVLSALDACLDYVTTITATQQSTTYPVSPFSNLYRAIFGDEIVSGLTACMDVANLCFRYKINSLKNIREFNFWSVMPNWTSFVGNSRRKNVIDASLAVINLTSGIVARRKRPSLLVSALRMIDSFLLQPVYRGYTSFFQEKRNCDSVLEGMAPLFPKTTIGPLEAVWSLVTGHSRMQTLAKLGILAVNLYVLPGIYEKLHHNLTNHAQHAVTVIELVKSKFEYYVENTMPLLEETMDGILQVDSRNKYDTHLRYAEVASRIALDVAMTPNFKMFAVNASFDLICAQLQQICSRTDEAAAVESKAKNTPVFSSFLTAISTTSLVVSGLIKVGLNWWFLKAPLSNSYNSFFDGVFSSLAHKAICSTKQSQKFNFLLTYERIRLTRVGCAATGPLFMWAFSPSLEHVAVSDWFFYSKYGTMHEYATGIVRLILDAVLITEIGVKHNIKRSTFNPFRKTDPKQHLVDEVRDCSEFEGLGELRKVGATRATYRECKAFYDRLNDTAWFKSLNVGKANNQLLTRECHLFEGLQELAKVGANRGTYEECKAFHDRLSETAWFKSLILEKPQTDSVVRPCHLFPGLEELESKGNFRSDYKRCKQFHDRFVLHSKIKIVAQSWTKKDVVLYSPIIVVVLTLISVLLGLRYQDVLQSYDSPILNDDYDAVFENKTSRFSLEDPLTRKGFTTASIIQKNLFQSFVDPRELFPAFHYSAGIVFHPPSRATTTGIISFLCSKNKNFNEVALVNGKGNYTYPSVGDDGVMFGCQKRKMSPFGINFPRPLDLEVSRRVLNKEFDFVDDEPFSFDDHERMDIIKSTNLSNSSKGGLVPLLEGVEDRMRNGLYLEKVGFKEVDLIIAMIENGTPLPSYDQVFPKNEKLPSKNVEMTRSYLGVNEIDGNIFRFVSSVFLVSVCRLITAPYMAWKLLNILVFQNVYKTMSQHRHFGLGMTPNQIASRINGFVDKGFTHFLWGDTSQFDSGVIKWRLQEEGVFINSRISDPKKNLYAWATTYTRIHRYEIYPSGAVVYMENGRKSGDAIMTTLGNTFQSYQSTIRSLIRMGFSEFDIWEHNECQHVGDDYIIASNDPSRLSAQIKRESETTFGNKIKIAFSATVEKVDTFEIGCTGKDYFEYDQKISRSEAPEFLSHSFIRISVGNLGVFDTMTRPLRQILGKLWTSTDNRCDPLDDKSGSILFSTFVSAGLLYPFLTFVITQMRLILSIVPIEFQTFVDIREKGLKHRFGDLYVEKLILNPKFVPTPGFLWSAYTGTHFEDFDPQFEPILRIEPPISKMASLVRLYREEIGEKIFAKNPTLNKLSFVNYLSSESWENYYQTGKVCQCVLRQNKKKTQ